jgi:uncharacterized alpha-E superfamily protein
MLGRTAASLFWMNRYIERAENIARLISVAFRESLTPDVGAGYREDWASILLASGCAPGFKAKHDKPTAAAVQDWLLLDRTNPSSVRSCIEAGRNNGRSVRTALTREMWEALNSTYNDFAAIGPNDLAPGRLPDVLDWIRARAALFRGAMLGSLLRDAGYHFAQLGTFVERGDNTARIIDVKYSVLLPSTEVAGGERNLHHMETILRSVSAHSAYRYFYKDAYRAPLVVDFLVLRPEMPRSLRFCADWNIAMLSQLATITGGGAASLALAQEIGQAVRADGPEAIFRAGLHDFLLDLLARNAALCNAAAEDYNFG